MRKDCGQGGSSSTEVKHGVLRPDISPLLVVARWDVAGGGGDGEHPWEAVRMVRPREAGAGRCPACGGRVDRRIDSELIASWTWIPDRWTARSLGCGRHRGMPTVANVTVPSLPGVPAALRRPLVVCRFARREETTSVDSARGWAASRSEIPLPGGRVKQCDSLCSRRPRVDGYNRPSAWRER